MDTPQLKRCPIGIQTFATIRDENYLYVDKTEYVYQLPHSDAKYCLLSRPRRFGKPDRSASEAIRQIDLKDYPSRFTLCGLPIVKVDIQFNNETRTVENWEIKAVEN